MTICATPPLQLSVLHAPVTKMAIAPSSSYHVTALRYLRSRLIPDCGDTDSSAAPSALSMAPISHWTTVGFCNGCPGGAARSMSQGLRVLVLARSRQRRSWYPALLLSQPHDKSGGGDRCR